MLYCCPHVRQAYINDTLFILIGSFIVALAMERWGLHTRVALRVLNPTHPSIRHWSVAIG
jgi:di/tricarboxylate transporter